MNIIRIDLGAEVDGSKAGKRHGIFEYSCVPYPLVRGHSRQPLLDACRQLKSLYAPTAQLAGLFREGRDTPDLMCSLDAGAATTVSEPDSGDFRFARYRAFDPARLKREVA